jgi:hypothetical protein
MTIDGIAKGIFHIMSYLSERGKNNDPQIPQHSLDRNQNNTSNATPLAVFRLGKF